MRILQVIASLDPVNGGPAESVRTTSKAWQAQGHTVEIATLDDPASPWLKPLPLIVHALGPGLLKYRYAPKFPNWLQANATRFDIVVLHGIYQYQAFATRQVLRRLGRPYVLFIHGALDPWFKRRYPLKHLKKWLYWPWGDYRVVRDAARVLFTTQDERSLARQSFWLYKAKEAVVTFGTSPAPVEIDDSQTRAFFEAFPALQSQPFLLFLSRIDEKKGCQLLIKSFAKIANQDPNLFLVMAGPDNSRLRVKLERLAMGLGIAHRMIWTGMISGSVKWGAYRAADAFVLTSHSENFGIVVAEALACGTPVLISKRVNIWREVVAAKAGLAADDSLGASVAMLTEWLANDTHSRQAMGARALELFQQNFEIDAASKIIAEELGRVLLETALPG